jgi:hypothetical protein
VVAEGTATELSGQTGESSLEEKFFRSPAARRVGRMGRGIFVVFAKEVIDNTRGRRSLMVAFIYPLVGPLILGVIILMVSNVVRVNPERHLQLPVVGAEHAPHLMAFLKNKRGSGGPSTSKY